VFYESPHRLLKTHQTAYDTLGDSTVVVGREQTKQYEEEFRGKLSEARAHWTAKPPKGEVAVVLYGVSDERSLCEWL
ncbi:MAG: 16S rRNA (cytidine(1402)-2'-O)-methyltransferase, partial [bacterium]|nr:16S rRNA (cytidine(1402)-2'-O)-methyltransferase [bacterium]